MVVLVRAVLVLAVAVRVVALVVASVGVAVEAVVLVAAGNFSYSKRQKAEGRRQKVEVFLLVRGCLGRSICPKLYGDSYTLCSTHAISLLMRYTSTPPSPPY